MHEPAIRVPPEFEREFPQGSALATECFLNLGVLVGGVRSAFDRLLLAEELPSMAAFNVLTVVDGAGGSLQPSVIAERMMVSRATMTGVIDSLEARGLVARSTDAADGRVRTVTITRAGRAVVRRLVPRAHRFERELMSTLDHEARVAIARAARRVSVVTAISPRALIDVIFDGGSDTVEH